MDSTLNNSSQGILCDVSSLLSFRNVLDGKSVDMITRNVISPFPALTPPLLLHDVILDSIMRGEGLYSGNTPIRTVSRNIKNAFTTLQQRLTLEEKSNWGLLDVETICYCHKQLFENIPLSPMMTAPGTLSSLPRMTTFQGVKHYYRNPISMEVALQTLLDHFNTLIDSYRYSLPDMLCVLGWFTYNFLDLHPFSDGNGRLTRIIVTHIFLYYFHFRYLSRR